MGLINTASSNNRQILEMLTVTYAKSKIQQEYTSVMGNTETTHYFVWEFRRFATCQYKYVGMSYAGAIAKQNELLEYYKRSFKISDWNPSQDRFDEIDGGSSLMGTQISVVKNVGHLYDVIVSVNEEDCKLRLGGSALSPQTVFYTENRRQYEIEN